MVADFQHCWYSTPRNKGIKRVQADYSDYFLTDIPAPFLIDVCNPKIYQTEPTEAQGNA
jgi:hypothetical protein